MDRNKLINYMKQTKWQSLSARRAWIEICTGVLTDEEVEQVALRKESVDRNASDTRYQR